MFDPYYKWLGIPPKDQPPNHYRLLSLELYERDLDVIEGSADRLMGFVRQYQSGENAAEAARILNELATARMCLLKPQKKPSTMHSCVRSWLQKNNWHPSFPTSALHSPSRSKNLWRRRSVRNQRSRNSAIRRNC